MRCFSIKCSSERSSHRSTSPNSPSALLSVDSRRSSLMFPSLVLPSLVKRASTKRLFRSENNGMRVGSSALLLLVIHVLFTPFFLTRSSRNHDGPVVTTMSASCIPFPLNLSVLPRERVKGCRGLLLDSLEWLVSKTTEDGEEYSSHLLLQDDLRSFTRDNSSALVNIIAASRKDSRFSGTQVQRWTVVGWTRRRSIRSHVELPLVSRFFLLSYFLLHAVYSSSQGRWRQAEFESKPLERPSDANRAHGFRESSSLSRSKIILSRFIDIPGGHTRRLLFLPPVYARLSRLFTIA